jgi:hypothetical protein
MLSAAQLREQIQAYISGRISLGAFEDWFYECSDDVSENDAADLVAEIDSVLSARHFEKLGQRDLRIQLGELANAVRPFVSLEHERSVVVYDYPKYRAAGAVAVHAAAIILSVGPANVPALAPSSHSESPVIVLANPLADVASVNSQIPWPLVEAEASVS